MRSWAGALKAIRNLYPDMRGIIEVDENFVTIRLSRWLTGGKRAGILKVIPVEGVESSFIDLVLVELQCAVAELQNFPYNHIRTFEIVGGRDHR